MALRKKRFYYFISTLVVFLLVIGFISKPWTGYKFDYYDSEVPDHEPFTELLGKYVDSKGRVDYEGFARDSARLNSYLIQLSQSPPNAESWPTEEQLSYWINAYNAFTIKLILNHYPVESIKDIGSKIQIPFINSPWDISFIKIGKTSLTLNNIEHRILRKEFNEPRIHFAIVCASISCPDLRREAYVSDKLEYQLDEQTIGFINDPSKNKVSPEEAKVSRIFQWFKGDFEREGTLKEYLNQYSDIKISQEGRIKYMDYNWGLNDQKE